MTGLFSRGLFSRSGWGKVMGPLIRWLVKHGVTANSVTVVGTLGVIVGALIFYSRGVFFVGTLIIWAFAMLDFVDGSVARAGRLHGVRRGARLDPRPGRRRGRVRRADLVVHRRRHSTPLRWPPALPRPRLGRLLRQGQGRGRRAELRRRAHRAAERLTTGLAGTGLNGLGRAVRAGHRAVGAGRAVRLHGRAAAGRRVPAVPGGAAGVNMRERAVALRRRLGRGPGVAPAGRVGRRSPRSASRPRAGTRPACGGCGRTWPGWPRRAPTWTRWSAGPAVVRAVLDGDVPAAEDHPGDGQGAHRGDPRRHPGQGAGEPAAA